MHIIFKCLATLSLALVTTQAAHADEGRLDPAELEAFVDGLVIPLMRANGSPSGTVAIALRGELIVSRGYGHQDLERRVEVQPEKTLFRPGSVSKLFTWVAVMQLVEQGRLDLDTDVNEYLSGFSIHDTYPEPVTLRHILTHTAGFEDGVLGYLIVENPEKLLPLAESMEKYQPARVNPPGAQTAYSNYATSLAGLIVANVSGLSFNEYVQRNIFDPLQMQNSSFEEPLPSRLAANMAVSYELDAGGYVARPFELVANFGPAGGASATATDMIRFAEAIRNGGELDGARILKAATVEKMLGDEFSHDSRLLGMGLGFYATEINGHRVMGHGGDTQWFHSILGIDRDKELSVFASFGASGGGAVRTALLPSLYDRFYPLQELPPVVPEDFAERAGRYAGTYGFWRSSFTKLEKALLGMGGGITVAPGPDNTLVLVIGDGAKQYVEVEHNLFREKHPGVSLLGGMAPRLVAFQEDASGEITGFVLDGLPFMSTRKLPAFATPGFNFTLLGLSVLVFIAVLARRFYQRREIRNWGSSDRAVLRVAVLTSGIQLLTLVTGVVLISTLMEQLFDGIPLIFKLWLWLPILTTLCTVWLLYTTTRAWRGGLLGGVFARLRLTVIAGAALFMVWFYYYWNILGFNYF
ncbi:serine hydrolase [Haliea sp. E1-2-M8]|uniref:serine hydrolase n=1 Tax=Haliea sp. E1-2-M8 TaxID=3064706 RepID=UPI0027179673|nr:serine hydrolase [Haliea sp. E1-2-M8]MDO8863183.1 serine hydrolase [Haliea sp. E1-2-M8]